VGGNERVRADEAGAVTHLCPRRSGSQGRRGRASTAVLVANGQAHSVGKRVRGVVCFVAAARRPTKPHPTPPSHTSVRDARRRQPAVRSF
jgi:hypothetical protein